MLDKLFWYLERKRLKFHFMKTEHELRNADVSQLDYKLKENRAKMIQLLNQYWKKEEFPKNTTHKVRIPQIKDKDGTLCAVAYLLEQSGNGKLVSQLASQNNLVYVKDVHDGPLLDWLKKSGITKQEAIKIQPMYHPPHPFPPPFHPAFIEIIQDNVSIGDRVLVSKISAGNEPTIMIIALALLSLGIGIFSYLIIRSLRRKSRK